MTMYPMNADDLLTVLVAKLKAKGPDHRGEYICWCPYHADGQGRPPHRPNLQISVRGFICHACGAKGGLRRLAERLGVGVEMQEREPEAVYDYRDERGRLLFQVCRFPGKRFRQRQPDSHGGWIWEVKGVLRVPYRLPELLASPESVVYITEGEKDADRLGAAGLVATTNPGGAGKWREDYGQFLRGRDVVILPDNDEPGHRHADQVAGLLAGVARTLKILELPGLKEKGDASEWLSQGRTMVELAALVEGAPLWSAGSDTRADEHPGAGPKGSQADRLVALADAADMQLFHDELGVGFARVPVGAHKEVWRCHSRGFKRWLAQGFWHTEKRAPRSEALGSALNVIEAMACFEGEEHALNNRVARFEEAIWYDRADPEWGAVKITSAGWELVADPPLLFRRYAHQGAQVTPVRGGSLLELLEFTNLRDGGQRLLLMTYLVSCLIPDIPHPLPLVHGPQGSAKSTLFRMLRRLIDPSAAEILGFPRDAAELTQQLSHHWAPFYDNLGDLPGWVSDLLCRAVTGEGFTKRELYTDDEDVIYRFRRCVGLNGINIAASAPDLLDRCLLFGLEPIADTNRKTEQQIWADFEMARPRLFGAMLDALAEAMARRRYVRLDKVPRMADFAFWGCAIAPALGYGPEEFMAAYQANSELRNEEVLESSPVALLVSELMKERTEWRGTASSLLTELEARAEDNHINTQGPGWPKAAHSLVRKLNTLKPNLAAAGITIERERDRAARDLLLKRRTAKDGCATGTSRLAAIDGASEAADACDACDAFSLPS